MNTDEHVPAGAVALAPNGIPSHPTSITSPIIRLTLMSAAFPVRVDAGNASLGGEGIAHNDHLLLVIIAR